VSHHLPHELKGNKWAAAISASENTIFKHCTKKWLVFQKTLQ